MVYLDYSATTKIDKSVLETFDKVSLEFFANPNSLHGLGVKAKELINTSTNQIADILKVNADEIIYTSGSSEANNMAIKGITSTYKTLGKHIITTKLEHSSVIAPISYLQKNGYEVSFVKINSDGLVDIDDLKELLKKDTLLVSISSVNSESGVQQNINEIGKIIKDNSKAIFHCDMTQSIGKVECDLTYPDLISFSAHKFYGPRGIGCLIKKNNIRIEPLIHGGKSTTIYRSGTPVTSLIASLAKALRLSYLNLEDKNNHILKLNNYLKENLVKYDNVFINSTKTSIPHILNFSVINVKPETLLHALEEYEIYISTQSACATGNISASIFSITNDEKRASSSIRISLSYLTTKEEIDYFLKYFDICYKNLCLK